MSTTCADYPTVREGDADDYVKFLQDQLQYMGYVPELDGAFGPQTGAAVRQLQAACGLVDDGVVGPKTWAQIGAILDAHAAPPTETWDAAAEQAEWASSDAGHESTAGEHEPAPAPLADPAHPLAAAAHTEAPAAHAAHTDAPAAHAAHTEAPAAHAAAAHPAAAHPAAAHGAAAHGAEHAAHTAPAPHTADKREHTTLAPKHEVSKAKESAAEHAMHAAPGFEPYEAPVLTAEQVKEKRKAKIEEAEKRMARVGRGEDVGPMPTGEQLVALCVAQISHSEYRTQAGHGMGADEDGDGYTEFDCSGLIEWACLELGVYVPRTGAVDYCHQHGGAIDVETARVTPGVIVTSGSHVGLTVGDGKYTIEAVDYNENLSLKEWRTYDPKRPKRKLWVRAGLVPGIKYPGINR